MQRTDCEANCRAPPPECCAIATWRKRGKCDPRQATQEIDAGDDANGSAQERELWNDASGRECIQRPCGKHKRNAGSDECWKPATGYGELSHLLAGAKEAIPRCAKNYAANVEQGGDGTQDCAGNQERIAHFFVSGLTPELSRRA